MDYSTLVSVLSGDSVTEQFTDRLFYSAKCGCEKS